MDFGFSLRIGDDGRLVEVDRPQHVRDMMEQVLFTRPGERVNRPDFGCGIQDLVFDPMDDSMISAVARTTADQLRQWLGDVIALQGVDVARVVGQDGVLQIVISYRLLPEDRTRTATFLQSP